MSDEQDQFDKELSWCIFNLRKVLQKTNPSKSEIKKALEALQILESTKTPIIKKRLAMRNALGDYRAKMASEEKTSQQQIINGKAPKFATFTSVNPEALMSGKVIAKAVENKKAAESEQSFSFKFDV